MTTKADLLATAANITPEMLQRELARRSLYEFVKQAWPHIEPGVQFVDNWHLKAICDHLQAVAEGTIRRLIINIPPRHMKSIAVAVCFPVWTWINFPHKKFLFASYAASLSVRDSTKCRRLIQSSWFQRNFSSSFQLTGDQNQKQRFENDKTGYRLATSVGGALTGEGGDIIAIDDPHNVKEAESEITRLGVLDWWDQAMQSRLNDPKTGAFIVIMQRVHHNDLVGHILKNAREDGTIDQWTHLCFPAKYEPDHPYPTQSALGFKDPRTEEGELLWPARFGEAELRALSGPLGTYGTAGQLQQRPSPKGGGILRTTDWRVWEKQYSPELHFVLQSWDTGYSEKDDAAFSACTTWGAFRWGSRFGAILLHRWRDRVPYPTLRREAQALYKEWQPDAVIIEKKSSGQALIKDLRMGRLPVLEYLPDRDKIARAHAASALLEAGLVWYPDKQWAQEVVDLCGMFPAGDGADIVDTVTQALLRFRDMWLLENPNDDEPLEDEDEYDNVIPLHRKPIYG